MRVLVTGATGFVGSFVARRFAEGGDEVLAIVRPPSRRLGLPGVRAVEADLEDRASLAVLDDLPAPDVVCHLAADTRMGATEAEMEANVRAIRNLLDALGGRLRGKRFLFASSIAAVDRRGWPDGPLTPGHVPAPRSAYARSKLRGEKLLGEEARRLGFHLAVLRLGTIYGPGQEKGGLVTLAQAARAGALPARLPWPGRISFGYAGDVAEVFARLASRGEPVSGTFFVAEGRAHTMAEAARILAEVQGVDLPPTRFPRAVLDAIAFLLFLPGVRRFAPWSLRAALADTIRCDTEPIRRLLGLTWTPLSEGLRRTFGPRRLRASPLAGRVRAKAAVTGATGFLGRALVRDLARAHGPEAVVGLVREWLPPGEAETAEELAALKVRLHPIDLLARPVLRGVELDVDVLYHLAAETDSGAPPERLRVNTEGTENLLETLGPGLAGRRVVLAGATAAIDRGRFPRGLLRETDPPSPRTAYGRSKLEAERILARGAERYGFSFVVPRLSPVWTPDLGTGFLAAFRDQVTGGSVLARVAWPGRVTMIRREDAVRILRHLGETGAADGKAVHVGDGRVYRYAGLLADLRERAGLPSRPLPIPGLVWGALRRAAWLPLVRRLVPWRLSCLLGDDLAADTTLLRSLFPGPLTTWDMSKDEIDLG